MILVQPEQLRHVWPLCEKWIDDAIAEGQGDEGKLDVLIAIARGVYLLFFDPEHFASVVHIQQFPAQKVATIVYIGGVGLEAMKSAFEQGKAWGRTQGINVVRTYGRPGWSKVMGLKPVGVILQETL